MGQDRLGEELRRARELVGLTQADLAELADVRSTYLGQVEHGTRSPSIDVLIRVCDALGVKASRIIGLVEQDRD